MTGQERTTVARGSLSPASEELPWLDRYEGAFLQDQRQQKEHFKARLFYGCSLQIVKDSLVQTRFFFVLFFEYFVKWVLNNKVVAYSHSK